MKNCYPVLDTVPHSGPMCLLDSIDDYGEDWLRASATLKAGHLFEVEGAIPGWVGIEYMAQAVAAWAGANALDAGRSVRIGFLVGTRKYQIDRPSMPLGSRLTISIRQLLLGDNGLGAFECLLQGSDQQGEKFAASANLNVFQPDNLNQLLKENS